MPIVERPMAAANAAAASFAALEAKLDYLDAADIDLVRREMVLHVLDANNAAAEVDAIRRDFEPPLLAWFGESA